METTKNCGGCIHWHKCYVPKSKRDIYKNGSCGLGYHNSDEVVECKMYRSKNAKEIAKAPEPTKEEIMRSAAEVTGTSYGRFTTNPWEQWRKK